MIELLHSLADSIQRLLPGPLVPYYQAAMWIYAWPLFYVGIAGILVLERILPAVRTQRVLSRGFLADFGWFNLDLAFKVAAFPAFAGMLALGYDTITGGFRIHALASMSLPIRVVLSFLAFDFLHWFHHWVRHKVALFWRFHLIHHSQREMNLFTDFRVHFIEYFVANVIEFIPKLMLGLTPFAIMGTSLVTQWHTRLIHANIRTNFGPLRYLVVSPQYHRVHHSIELEHRDRNFGVHLTIWDRIFGTLHPDDQGYPATGTVEKEFVPPTGASPRRWLAYFAEQIIWPFRRHREAIPAESPTRVPLGAE